jgi:branched-chain amino acid aminotransferase
VVYLNGRIVEPSEARVSAFDRGFLYGDALFETMRAYGGRIFRLQQHLDRLNTSATFLGFDLSMPAEPFSGAVTRTLAASTLADAYVRLTVTRGTGRGLMPAARDSATVMIEVRPLSPYPARLYEQGAQVIISRYRRDESSPLSNHKITNYLTAILAKREAAAAHCDDALLLNNRGDVAEATVSNVFVVKNGRIVTPPVSAGILPGITRATIMEICRQSSISLSEASLSLDELLAADEVFLTNSLMEIMPVRRVADRPIGAGTPGPVTLDLQEQYRGAAAGAQ